MNGSVSTCKLAAILVIAICSGIYQNVASPAGGVGRARPAGTRVSDSSAVVDTTMTEQEYLGRLQAADTVTFKRDFENYFLLLLDNEQKAEYDSLQSLEEKKAFIRHYWKASNPNPLFPENDWLLEFNRRVQYAKKHYRQRSSPYVDDRGIYYIKYGEPRRKFVDIGGLARLDDDFRVTYWTTPNETWAYDNIQSNFVVYFVQDGFSYRQVRGLYEALSDWHGINMKYFLWRDMIEKRQHISPVLARAVRPIRIFGATSFQAALMDRAEELVFQNQMARAKAPPAARDPFQAENKLKFYDRVAQFRGPSGTTKIDVALLVPLEKNLIKKIRKSLEDTLLVEYSGMLRDANFEPLMKNQSSSQLVVASIAGEKLPNAVGEFVLQARPQQDSDLTLQIEEKQHENFGYRLQPFQIRDFSAKAELMVSDIQLNYRIENEAQKRLLPARQLEEDWVSPYPYEKISKKNPPLVYFEIYNAQSAGIGENVLVSYTITSLKKHKPAVNVSFTRPVLGDSMAELVGIDLNKVREGWHLLEVSASSLQAPVIKAVSQKKLFVKE